jgi:transposase
MSWDLPVGEAFLPRVSMSHLKKLAANESIAAARVRLLVALHRKQGWSIDSIAESVSLHRRSVHDILHRFIERGLKAAESLPKSGRKKRLSNVQLKSVKNKLLKSPKSSKIEGDFWNSKMVSELVRRECGVSYTARHTTRLLSKLGFSYKKPRPANPRRASDEEIAAFKKKRVERCWLPSVNDALFL